MQSQWARDHRPITRRVQAQVERRRRRVIRPLHAQSPGRKGRGHGVSLEHSVCGGLKSASASPSRREVGALAPKETPGARSNQLPRRSAPVTPPLAAPLRSSRRCVKVIPVFEIFILLLFLMFVAIEPSLFGICRHLSFESSFPPGPRPAAAGVRWVGG